MSRGPGRIERAIRDLLDAHPDLAFVTDELVEHCYPGVTPIERKHQVSVLRAAHRVVAGDPDWTAWRIEGQGRGWLFVNLGNLQSYALGRMIGDQFNIYRSEKRAQRRAGGHQDIPVFRQADGSLPPLPQYTNGWGRPMRACYIRVHGRFDYVRVFCNTGGLICDRDRLLTELREDEHYRKLMAPDGGWARHVQLHCAERDGSTELAAALKERQAAATAAWLAAGQAMFGGKRFPATAASGKETHNDQLAAMADRVRAIAAQNDPDVVRTALADIAAELDALAGVEPQMGRK
jgi:hypothetical protein